MLKPRKSACFLVGIIHADSRQSHFTGCFPAAQRTVEKSRFGTERTGCIKRNTLVRTLIDRRWRLAHWLPKLLTITVLVSGRWSFWNRTLQPVSRSISPKPWDLDSTAGWSSSSSNGTSRYRRYSSGAPTSLCQSINQSNRPRTAHNVELAISLAG